ncbi:unnamed protein product [Withania somnifera]
MVDLLNTREQWRDFNNSKDKLVRVQDKYERFSVGSAYRNFQRATTHQGYWPWKVIWKVKVPLEVPCFTWILAKQPALNYLMKRRSKLCSRCSFCECEAETTNHFFLHCRVTGKLW